MINQDNFKSLLKKLEFKTQKNSDEYTKQIKEEILKVDFKKKELIYPENVKIHNKNVCNFKQNENFVVFECVHRLLEKGYKANHIELEPKWKVGHGQSGGRADILVRKREEKTGEEKTFLLIECKTAGKEFEDEWGDMQQNGGQLFTYAQQERSAEHLCLYTADYIDDKVKYENHIIRIKDNEKSVEDSENKENSPLFYKDANTVEAIYQVWQTTYKRDFKTKGIFEEKIKPYTVGKEHYKASDLSDISSNDIQKKYHEFATVLRQHNVSGKENAFDKLVNLFLCKIVDETNNPDQLRFRWFQSTDDTPFYLQDRLHVLYKEGMKKFLGEEVTYIDNNQIKNAFRFFEDDPHATEKTIKEYFKALKFFTNNDFAFIDVHNEKLFYQNADVLLKIVQMLQDIRLKSENENQFLGDMFEGFLDQGIKQSEGQFFTPMPIVWFILSSLPLEKLIDGLGADEMPKVIDYACGAGHFLNEYALQIKPIVTAKYKDKEEIKNKLKEYYSNVIGIEKEYRLSKVSKVSAFMYGQDEIEITYADTLSSHEKIKDGNFDLLVTNPPYSVKGFLETLNKEERERFELIKTIDEKSYSSNNSIETFFIERAKQLVKSGGIATIIAPSSILTKGNQKVSTKKNIYVRAREILLENFNIVAIAGFGSGTFGKTGTNTVILFMTKRQEGVTDKEHYKDRVEAWFKGYLDDHKSNKVYKDVDLISKYCAHVDIGVKHYKNMLNDNLDDELLKTGIFKEYKKSFENSEGKKLKNQRSFKLLSSEEQKEELQKKFLEYVKKIEADKLYYFILAYTNSRKVVIMNMPDKTAEAKKFLGYEWSNAKGNEGIKIYRSVYDNK